MKLEWGWGNEGVRRKKNFGAAFFKFLHLTGAAFFKFSPSFHSARLEKEWLYLLAAGAGSYSGQVEVTSADKSRTVSSTLDVDLFRIPQAAFLHSSSMRILGTRPESLIDRQLGTDGSLSEHFLLKLKVFFHFIPFSTILSFLSCFLLLESVHVRITMKT